MTNIAAIEPPRIYPTVRYRDAEAMIRWLIDVLASLSAWCTARDGVVHHAELAYGSSMLMLGQIRDDDYGKLIGDPNGGRTDALYVRRRRSGRVARQSKSGRRENRNGAAQHRLRQPRFRLPGSGRQSLEFRDLLAEGQREAIIGIDLPGGMVPSTRDIGGRCPPWRRPWRRRPARGAARARRS